MQTHEIVQTLVLTDLANRLAYLGYHGEELDEFIVFALSEGDLNAYQHIVTTSDAAGFCPFTDRKPWGRRGLPSPDKLPYLRVACEHLLNRLFPNGGLD